MARCSQPSSPGAAHAPSAWTLNEGDCLQGLAGLADRSVDVVITDPPYEAANVRVVSHNLKDTPLRPSNLRAPGKIANVFAVESFTERVPAHATV